MYNHSFDKDVYMPKKKAEVLNFLCGIYLHAKITCECPNTLITLERIGSSYITSECIKLRSEKQYYYMPNSFKIVLYNL